MPAGNLPVSASPVTETPPSEAPAAAPLSDAAFRRDVLDGLQEQPKTLPCKYFYDARGSDLFEQITRLDAYYPTRTETAILEAYGDEMADLIGPDARIVEYGSGSSEKTLLLLEKLDAPAAYVPIDISDAALSAAADRTRQRFPDLVVAPVVADYTAPFVLPGTPGRRTVVFFPGSTIGNFEPENAAAFLAGMARVAGAHGGLLIGVDLKKDRATLERAYDDDEGVTAAFNLNLLARINRELGGGFDLTGFAHEARWNEEEGRVEMHLVSLREQTVEVGGASVFFGEGETIHTENSYKYTPDGFAHLAAQAGFDRTHLWTDADERFSVQYLTVAD